MKSNIIVKTFIFFLSSFTISVSFQNCAKSSQENMNESSLENKSPVKDVDSDQSSKVATIDLTKAVAITLPVDPIISLKQVGVNYKLFVNLENGEMKYINDEDEVISPIRYCLYKDEVQALKGFINNANICIPESLPSGYVCTADYIFPYSKIILDDNQILKLGEKSGCNKSPDLCDDSKKALNGYISYLSSHIESRKCL
ncbi:MAG: hypothetical protein KDD45_05390 [Bdellovibrionales bacterium]|nr:hypothetical protein [Bdellovibrionales bacterium]